jgi:flagellar motility protein MotE (MotC chaperone)
MIVAFLLLGVKVGDVVRGGKQITLALSTQATAQQTVPSPASAQQAISSQTNTQSAASAPSPAPVVTPQPSAALDSVSPEAENASKSSAETSQPSKTEPTQVTLPTTNTNEVIDPIDDVCTTRKKLSPQLSSFIKKLIDNPTVQDIVLSLDKRRDEIEQWAKQLEMKENMMQATEQRIGDKIAQIKKLQKDLEVVLVEYNKHEDAKIRSLVKIYENMKPADAARIFDEMEMPILLEVVDKMSERKAAPILANMTPIKAKELTVELAEQRKLQQPMLDAISASQQDDASANQGSPNAASAAAN